jgi:hypothetical protein
MANIGGVEFFFELNGVEVSTVYDAAFPDGDVTIRLELDSDVLTMFVNGTSVGTTAAIISGGATTLGLGFYSPGNNGFAVDYVTMTGVGPPSGAFWTAFVHTEEA